MSSPAKALLSRIIALAAALLAVWLWSVRNDDERAAVDGHRQEAQDGPTLGGPEGGVRAPRIEGAPREEPQVSRESARNDAEPEDVLVRGVLILVDGWGKEHAHENGQFELSVWGPSVSMHYAAEHGPSNAGLRERLRRRHVTAVRVENGRWQERLPVHTARSLTRGRLAGQALFDLQVEELEGDDPGTIELRVTGRALYPATMSVVDRDTQRPLESVRIVTIEPGDPRVHPGDLAPSQAPTPIVLPAPDVDRRVYLVGAPDHAWRRVEWNHLSPAPRVVELERAGSIALRVFADGSMGALAVTLTSRDGAPYARIPVAEPQPMSLAAVAPGAYRVALVPQTSLVQAQVPSLVETSATVVAGVVTDVDLQAKLGERPATVELAGRIHMSTDWSTGGPHLVLRALGTSALWHMETAGQLGGLEVDRQGSSWSFRSAEAVAGGRYLFTERRTSFAQEIQVGPLGSTDCLLEIPDPVTIRVEVVDRATGLPIPAGELDWLPPMPSGLPRPSASRSLWIQPTEPAGVFGARVPAWDRLEFEARAPGYRSSLGELELGPGRAAELRIALDRL